LEELFHAYAAVASVGESHFRVIHGDVFIEVLGGYALDGFFYVALHGFLGLAFVDKPFSRESRKRCQVWTRKGGLGEVCAA